MKQRSTARELFVRKKEEFWMWWCMPVVPAMQEAQIGGSGYDAGPR
jgi:hypothetical protein